MGGRAGGRGRQVTLQARQGRVKRTVQLPVLVEWGGGVEGCVLPLPPSHLNTTSCIGRSIFMSQGTSGGRVGRYLVLETLK